MKKQLSTNINLQENKNIIKNRYSQIVMDSKILQRLQIFAKTKKTSEVTLFLNDENNTFLTIPVCLLHFKTNDEFELGEEIFQIVDTSLPIKISQYLEKNDEQTVEKTLVIAQYYVAICPDANKFLHL